LFRSIIQDIGSFLDIPETICSSNNLTMMLMKDTKNISKIASGQIKNVSGKKKIEKKLRKINNGETTNISMIVNMKQRFVIVMMVSIEKIGVGPRRKENGDLRIEQMLLVEILKRQELDLLLARM